MVDDIFTWEILQVQIYYQCSGQNILVHIVKENYLNIFVCGNITRVTKELLLIKALSVNAPEATKQYCYFKIIHCCNYDRFFFHWMKYEVSRNKAKSEINISHLRTHLINDFSGKMQCFSFTVHLLVVRGFSIGTKNFVRSFQSSKHFKVL